MPKTLQNEAQRRFPASPRFRRTTLPICARRVSRGVFSADNQQSVKRPPTGVGAGWVVTGLEKKKDTEFIRALVSMSRLRWMPRLDSDQCVRLQGALCYRYTTGQCGASRGNRTLMSSLEGWRSTVEPWMRFGRPQCQRQVIQSPLRSPACPSDDASTQRRLGACRTRQLVGEGGLEPPTKTL